jgi:DNA-binding CsgD family transcriptional regulator
MPTLGDLLYGAVDGAYAVDARQRIIYWDAGCEELFGRSSNWVLGRPCCDVICGHNPVTDAQFCKRGCCVANMASGKATDAPKSFSIKTNDNKGEKIVLSVNIVLLPSMCKKGWVVMHLLNRSMSTDVLSSIDYAMSAGNPAASSFSNAADTRHGEDEVSRLTGREKEVLQLLAEGISLASIGKRLLISLTTVRNHMQHIQKRLGVHSQTEAVAYAYRHNLVH